MQTWSHTNQDASTEYIESLDRSTLYSSLHLPYFRTFDPSYINNIHKYPSESLYAEVLGSFFKYWPTIPNTPHPNYWETYTNAAWLTMLSLFATSNGYTEDVDTDLNKLTKNRNFNFASKVTPLADGHLYKDQLLYSAYSSFNFINYRDTDITYPDNVEDEDIYAATTKRRNEIYVYSPVSYTWDGDPTHASSDFDLTTPACHLVRDNTVVIAGKNWKPHELFYTNLWIRPVTGADETPNPLHDLDLSRTCPLYGISEQAKISKLIKVGYSIGAKNKTMYDTISPYLAYTFDGIWDVNKYGINPDSTLPSTLNFTTPDSIDTQFDAINQLPYNVPRAGEKCMIVLNVENIDIVINHYSYTTGLTTEYARYPICSPIMQTVFTFAPSVIANGTVPYDTNFNF